MERQLQKHELVFPEWLDHLLRHSFFKTCSLHLSGKNQQTIFCLDCHTSHCFQCIPSHPSHRLLRIRSYIYREVIRLDDAEKLFDCCQIQPYISNGFKVVFLNPRSRCPSNSRNGNVCGGCECVVRDPFHFCSMSCKVDYVLENEGLVALHGYLRDNFPPANDVVANNNGENLTPDSVLETVTVSVHSTSDSSGGSAKRNPTLSMETTGSGQFDGFLPRKKRTPTIAIRVDPVVSHGSSDDGSGGLSGCCVNSLNGRRKSAPQRAALA